MRQNNFGKLLKREMEIHSTGSQDRLMSRSRAALPVYVAFGIARFHPKIVHEKEEPQKSVTEDLEDKRRGNRFISELISLTVHRREEAEAGINLLPQAEKILYPTKIRPLP